MFSYSKSKALLIFDIYETKSGLLDHLAHCLLFNLVRMFFAYNTFYFASFLSKSVKRPRGRRDPSYFGYSTPSSSLQSKCFLTPFLPSSINSLILGWVISKSVVLTSKVSIKTVRPQSFL